MPQTFCEMSFIRKFTISPRRTRTGTQEQ
jgi:hypothetical protein